MPEKDLPIPDEKKMHLRRNWNCLMEATLDMLTLEMEENSESTRPKVTKKDINTKASWELMDDVEKKLSMDELWYLIEMTHKYKKRMANLLFTLKPEKLLPRYYRAFIEFFDADRPHTQEEKEIIMTKYQCAKELHKILQTVWHGKKLTDPPEAEEN